MKNKSLILPSLFCLLVMSMLISCSWSKSDVNKLRGSWKFEKWIDPMLPNGEVVFPPDIFVRYTFMADNELITQAEDEPTTFSKYYLKDSILEIGSDRFIIRRLDEQFLVIVKKDNQGLVEVTQIYTRLED